MAAKEIVQELKKPNGSEDLALAQDSPFRLMEIALSHSAGIDVIERLSALHEKALARDAEIQFNEAMNRVQSELGRIAPDLTNPQTHSKYASYAALDRVVRPIYTREGFSLSFDTGDAPHEDMVRVLCYVSHRAGHTRNYRVDMPADGKGAKGGDVMTKTHATGAGMSYGSRYLLKLIFNVAVGEEDSDGNGAGNYKETESQIAKIEKCNSVAELQELYLAAYRAAKDAKDAPAAKAIAAAKDKRKAELQKPEVRGVTLDWGKK